MMIYSRQKGFIYCWFDPDSRSQFQKLISLVGVGQKMLQFCLFFSMAYRRLIWLVCYFTASPGSFLSCCGENHPDPKLGLDLDPDKPGCTMSCEGDETDPPFFSRVVELVNRISSCGTLP